MKYELEDMLRVRNLRKNKASDALVKAKRELAAAEEFEKLQQQKLEEFLEKKPAFISKIYDKLVKKTFFKINAMDLVALKLSKLDQRQTKLDLNLKDAHNKTEAAQKNVDDCKQGLMQAIANLNKIEEHKKTWKDEFNALQEFLQEKEMEDFKTKNIQV